MPKSINHVKMILKKIGAQLRELSRGGHDIFPHIHPHWLSAVYLPEINQWQLSDTTLYRFHKLSPSQREEIFTGSVNLLHRILGKNSKPIDGFRAGGWSIQPTTDFIPCFNNTGIKYEFSVLPGYYQLPMHNTLILRLLPVKRIIALQTM